MCLHPIPGFTAQGVGAKLHPALVIIWSWTWAEGRVSKHSNPFCHLLHSQPLLVPQRVPVLPGDPAAPLAAVPVFPKYLCFTPGCSKSRPLVVRDQEVMDELELSFAWTNLLAEPRVALRGQGRGTEAACGCSRGPWFLKPNTTAEMSTTGTEL